MPGLQPPAHLAGLWPSRLYGEHSAGDTAPLETGDGASAAAFLGAKKRHFIQLLLLQNISVLRQVLETCGHQVSCVCLSICSLVLCCSAQMGRLHGTPMCGMQRGTGPDPAHRELSVPRRPWHPSLSPSLWSSPVRVPCSSQMSCPNSESVQVVDAERPKVTQIPGVLIRSWFSANRAPPSAATLNIDTQSRVGQGVQGVLRPLRERSPLFDCHRLCLVALRASS